MEGGGFQAYAGQEGLCAGLACLLPLLLTCSRVPSSLLLPSLRNACVRAHLPSSANALRPVLLHLLGPTNVSAYTQSLVRPRCSRV